MLPVTLDLTNMNIAVIGNGPATLRRLNILDEAGAGKKVAVFGYAVIEDLRKAAAGRLICHWPSADELKKCHIAFFVDCPEKRALPLAEKLRKAGKLVNVEDVVEGCNFHNASIIRRGDLLISVGTGGKCPALTARIRQLFEKIFPEEWADRLNQLGRARLQWKEEGASMQECFEKANKYIDDRKWWVN
ncbi:hypothetical protein N9W34_04215 [Rickettsiales bacterium]|nr:hypothetical protein [Rickettsiales bacterium]